MARGERVSLEIAALAPGGEAAGRDVGGAHAGRVTFVGFAAPGERVRARLVQEKSRVAWGVLEAIERESPDRVRPVCGLFGVCGGCQWQHVNRSAQLEAKRRIVERAMGIPVERVISVGPDLGYRERARLVVGKGPDGSRTVGFRGWRSHAVVDIPSCPLLGPALAQVLPAVRARAQRCIPRTEVLVQAGRDGVIARFGTDEARLYRIRDGKVHEESVSADEPVDVSEPGSPALRIPAGAFAQVSAAASAALVAAVLDQVGPTPGRTLELYAGSGNFTRHLVLHAPEVWATDGDRESVARGQRQFPGVHWLDTPRVGAVEADTVVVDPPRAGLDDVAFAIAAAARQRLVYVSCDPQTLGRDAKRLRAQGLVLEKLVAFDLMPQTFHVEVVASFSRAS